MKEGIFDTFPQITTERLILKEIKQEDAASIYKILSNPDVVKYDTFEIFTNINQAENLINWFSKKLYRMVKQWINQIKKMT
jgi:ribosomal-protein-alanine N-acetyltransferase